MKLILAVVNHEDSGDVVRALTSEKFSVTKLATTGGFLMAGNVTLLVGVDDDKVDKAVGIIGESSHSRRELIPALPEMSLGVYAAMPVEVVVGGAVVFVLPVEGYFKF